MISIIRASAHGQATLRKIYIVVLAIAFSVKFNSKQVTVPLVDVLANYCLGSLGSVQELK